MSVNLSMFRVYFTDGTSMEVQAASPDEARTMGLASNKRAHIKKVKRLR